MGDEQPITIAEIIALLQQQPQDSYACYYDDAQGYVLISKVAYDWYDREVVLK